jgi:hypothetical protein
LPEGRGTRWDRWDINGGAACGVPRLSPSLREKGDNRHRRSRHGRAVPRCPPPPRAEGDSRNPAATRCPTCPTLSPAPRRTVRRPRVSHPHQQTAGR